MVYDFENLRLLQAGNGLMQLVMIHKHHTLALWAQQVKARERTHHAILHVENRITAKAGLERFLLHLI